jgi:hypothetical protein
MNTLVLRRKLFYVGAIVLLLIPLYFLGNPSIRDKDGEPTNEGGTLARLRIRDDLGQSDLGALNPASESARLATLGLRGVAATILWQKAEHYKKEGYFDRMAAAINQLKVLQPHFVKVWDFQAHNMTYNTSVEFDNYKHRYDWVKKGIYYLLEGCKYNKTRTELPFQIGDFVGSKMGIADEKVQFRELFRNDREFHREVSDISKLDMNQTLAQGPDAKPDNWLAGAMWYERAYDMVDKGGRAAKSPLMFYCKQSQWHMKHSEAIQSEGYLGEEARNAWNVAGKNLEKFGQRPIRTSWGTTVFLSQLANASRELAEKEQEFTEFCGEIYTQLMEKQKESLSELQRTALSKESIEWTFEEMIAADEAKGVLRLNPMAVAKALPSEKQLKGLELAKQLKVYQDRRDHIDRYRAQINYSYWEARCRAEQADAALAARTKMYQADKSLDLGKLDEAIELYEQAWQEWNKLFNQYPQMMIDDAADEVEKSITSYLPLIERSRENLPPDFVLKNFLDFRELHEKDSATPSIMNLISQWPDRYPDRDFLEEVLAKSGDYAKKLQEYRKQNPPPTEADFRAGQPQDTPPVPPQADMPKPEEPKPEEPKPEEPKVDEPKPEEPKPEEPKVEEPKTEEPKTEEPKTEEPKAEEPKVEEPKTE